MNEWIIGIALMIHVIMCGGLFLYLYMDARKIDIKGANEAILFLMMVSQIWIIYWSWFVYDDIKQNRSE